MSDCSSVFCGFTPLSSQTTARPRTAGTSFGSQVTDDRQTVKELRRRGLWTLRTNRNVVVDTQSDGYALINLQTSRDGRTLAVLAGVAAPGTAH
jgi:hypothetical protein